MHRLIFGNDGHPPSVGLPSKAEAPASRVLSHQGPPSRYNSDTPAAVDARMSRRLLLPLKETATTNSPASSFGDSTSAQGRCCGELPPHYLSVDHSQWSGIGARCARSDIERKRGRIGLRGLSFDSTLSAKSARIETLDCFRGPRRCCDLPAAFGRIGPRRGLDRVFFNWPGRNTEMACRAEAHHSHVFD
jgi:hypothetical protein